MIFLTSKFNHYIKDEQGNRVPCIIKDENLILTKLKNKLSRRDNFLFVANDPTEYEINDNRMTILKNAFDLTGLSFRNINVLDNRTIDRSNELIKNADLIFVAGGRILCQINFLKKIDFLSKLSENKGLVICASASSMCLTRTICNFPEKESNLNEPRWVKGLGLIDLVLIPHFDGENIAYQGTCEIDLINNFILPLSKEKKLIGLPNGSYIQVENNKTVFCGNYYEIKNRKVKKITV